MFNKKMVSAFLTTVGALLALKVLLLFVMFVWSFFGLPLIPIFNGMAAPLDAVLMFVQEVGASMFQFSFVAVLFYATKTFGKGGAAAPVRHVAKK